MVEIHQALQGIEFRDESDDPNNRESSIREIILRQIRKIGDICAQELTPGYWEKKPHKTSGGVVFTEEYHPDLKEAYCNAVDFIVDLVYPYADSKLKPVIDEEEKKALKDINLKLSSKRKIFREINIFFEREMFFDSKDYSDE